MKTEKFRHYIKVLALVIVFSFIWGAWWGFYRLEKLRPSIKYKDSVRVLTLKNYLHPDFVLFFEKKNRIKLNISEKNTDLEILREALSNNRHYDLILINSFIAKSFIIDNVLTPLSENGDSIINRLSDISVDFKGMDYDPENKYLVPITWGLNGFLIDAQKISLKTETLHELLSANEVSVFTSPVELFNMITKLKPIVKNWVETGQSDELDRELKELRTRFKKFSDDPRLLLKDNSLDVGQITNGQAADLVGQGSNYRFVLPKERATLWIYSWGISRGVNDLNTTAYVLNEFLLAEINEKLVRSNEHASTLSTLNDSSLPLLRKASFIRHVPLSRVELFINHEALEPIWNNAIDDLFKTRR